MGPRSEFGILELIFWLSAGADRGKSGSRDEAEPCRSVSRAKERARRGGRRSESQRRFFRNTISHQLFGCLFQRCHAICTPFMWNNLVCAISFNKFTTACLMIKKRQRSERGGRMEMCHLDWFATTSSLQSFINHTRWQFLQQLLEHRFLKSSQFQVGEKLGKTITNV